MKKYYGIYMVKVNERNGMIITHEFIGMFNPYQVNKIYNNFTTKIFENLSYYEL